MVARRRWSEAQEYISRGEPVVITDWGEADALARGGVSLLLKTEVGCKKGPEPFGFLVKGEDIGRLNKGGGWFSWKVFK